MHKQHVTVLKDELKRLRNYGRPVGDNFEAKDDQDEKNVKRKGLRGSRRKKQNERMKRLSAQPNWKRKLAQAKNSGTSKPIREAKSNFEDKRTREVARVQANTVEKPEKQKKNLEGNSEIQKTKTEEEVAAKQKINQDDQ